MFKHKPIPMFVIGFFCGALMVGIGSWQWQRSNSEVFVEEGLQTPQIFSKVPITEKEESLSEVIVIHLAGAVSNPGLLSLPATSRLGEAIEKAGGALEQADLDQLNLAVVLKDGARYFIPTVEQQQEQTEQEKASDPIQEGKLDLNLAKIADLTELPQIGETRAKAILEYREKQGRFHSTDEIMNVPGIGEGIYAVIRDQITVR